MGTTQRKEQRKMKLEKEIIILTKLHQNTDKREFIQNINHVLKAQGIHLNRKVKWICKVTGSSGRDSIYMVYQCQMPAREQNPVVCPVPDGARLKNICI